MYTNYNDLILMRSILKGICGLMFVIIPFLTTKQNKKIRTTKYFKTMISGLTLAAVGDLLLDIDNLQFGILFVIGMAFFALTHVMFSLAFLKHIKFNKTTITTLILLLIPVITIINFLNLINAGDLTLVINIYAFIISIMVSLSVTLFTKKQLNKYFRNTTLTGVILFAISDLILVFALFGNNPTKELLLTNNFVYYIAQLTLGLSFYKMKHTYK
jgi:uncharacterized membrane protein YhhN